VAPEVSVNDPRVIVGEMQHADGRRFVWFISESEAPSSCTPRLSSGTLRELDGGAVRLPIELEAFGVRVLERTG
jgi:hypothetical protein